ncbi:MAG: hypothetical protein HQL37_07025 [Alphaproteobacteria bacterium]|nr:hypothetical protein [Alphaproteobacteria bacterium]
MLIGIDFDNTISCYDHAFSYAARDMGLVVGCGELTKEEVRTRVRSGPHGETGWQRLQGRVYGHYLEHASVFEGFADFVGSARARGHRLRIISHKTRFGHFDPDRIDLTAAARDWMGRHGFFDAAGLAFDPAEVSFHPSRDDKVAAIVATGCEAFIDDLPEVLLDPGFPSATRRFLFAAAGREDLPAFPTWAALTKAVLA